jgi:hypothetical protein
VLRIPEKYMHMNILENAVDPEALGFIILAMGIGGYGHGLDDRQWD